MAVHHIPEGFHTIQPYVVSKNATQLVEFITQVFDAKEIFRMEKPEGGIAHAEFRIGDSTLELADETEHWDAMPCNIHIYVPDCVATFNKALDFGVQVLSPLQDQFYGERSGSVKDPTGNCWHIATKTEELSKEEMKRRADQYQAEHDQK